MYLGDGCISKVGRSLRLRVFLDAGYPEIVGRCVSAMSAVMPTSNPATIGRPGCCIEAYCYSILWPDLLPQHGDGPKHTRRIELEGWQQRLVQAEPRRFIQGLFESDGCYIQNPVRAPSGKRYAYDRYFFSNKSDDIKELFRWACALIGVETRVANKMNVSVARRGSVAILNEFLGPKK